MDTVLDIVSQVVAQRLQQKDVQRLLRTLSTQDYEELTTKIAEILSKVSALIDVSHQVSTTLSLDLLLQHIIAVTTEALNVDRGTLFLHDKERGELYAKIAQGGLTHEIRIAEHQGIAGAVFTSGQAVIVHDAYADPRFNRDIDFQHAYQTRNILCAPIKTRNQTIIGVTQLLNKKEGHFTADDLILLEAMTSQVSEALQNAQLFAQVQRVQEEQAQLLAITTALSKELHLQPLVLKIMETTSTILEAERSTLFLYDDRTDELWALAAQSADTEEIRFPSRLGIAGAVFTSHNTLNIPDAYVDPRFNPEVDKKSGYRTRSILCMPIIDKADKAIGVIQVLNKRGGPFTASDEKRLQALAAQATVAIENAKLFDDILNMRNYNESILHSLSNGVITLNAENRVVKCNQAAGRILNTDLETLVGQAAHACFAQNAWVLHMLERVCKTAQPDVFMDTELVLYTGERIAVNLTVAPLMNIKRELIGSMFVFEDITSEKRVKSTFGRYLSQEVVEEILSAPAGLKMGGEMREVTFLVSDLRGFTSLSAHLSPQDIVNILNRYLERMVDIIAYYRGTVDEFQGDGILAFFGAPLVAHDDPERAVACALAMQQALVEINAEQQQRHLPELAMGIGINTGEVIVGNIGSERRAKYGAVGSAINAAYRIESYTIGGQILVSPSTYARVCSLVTLRGTMDVKFKGLDQSIALYDIASLGAPYHLALPATAPLAFVALLSPLPIVCFPVQDKTVSDTALAGYLTHLAGAMAQVTLTAQVDLLTNLQVILAPPAAASSPEIYAKVVAFEPSDAGSTNTNVRLVFTSLPDEAKAMLGQHDLLARAHGAQA